MSKRSSSHYAVKTVRISGWVLLPFVLGYICTGLSMCGTLGVLPGGWVKVAELFHKTLVWPLAVSFLVHTAAGGYLAMRRWGWIGKAR